MTAAIYLRDAAGLLTGPVELPVVPGLGVQIPSNAIALPEPLPAANLGHAWVYLDGTVQQFPYYSGPAYSTQTGEVFHFEGLGGLPDGLTLDPRPSEFHYWESGAWVLDEAAKADAEREAAQAANPRPSEFHHWENGAWVLDEIAQQAAALVAERAWRDARIASTDFLAMPDYPLGEPLKAELYAYRQALRDWPQSPAFPNPEDRPQPPEWLLGLLANAA